MLSIIDGVTLAQALSGPCSPSVKRLLTLRRNQLGEGWIEAAIFHVIEPGDTMADAERVIRFPLLIEDMPACEWALCHGDVIEVTFILSDDAPAAVLIVPNAGVCADLLALAKRLVETAGMTGQPHL